VRKAALVTSILVVALQSCSAYAAGSYEGTWQGSSKGTLGPGCGTTTAATMVVQGDRVVGEDAISAGSAMPTGRFAIRGNVSTDGAFSGNVGEWGAKGKFAGDTFDGDYEFGSCTMLMHLTRIK
jgi:hypothetical protein